MAERGIIECNLFNICIAVSEPLVIRVPPTSQTVEEGSKVSLQCHIDGHPHTVHWLHNAVMLLEDNSDITITGTTVFLYNSLVTQCHHASWRYWH